MRTLIAVLSIALGACQSSVPVYDRPIPDTDDAAGLIEIRDALPPEDREAWAQIVMRKVNPIAEGVTSKTVGEAIKNMKARAACMNANSNFDASDIEHSNRQAKSYNECLKMPI